MKILKYITIGSLACLVVSLSSCSKKFLERTPTNALSNELALTTVDRVSSGTVGIISNFAISAYAGRDLPVIGDLITDNLTTSAGNSGHLLDIENWNLSSSLTEVSNIWVASYQIVATATKVIEACNKLMPSASTTDKKTLQTCKATAITAKVFAEYVLTQYYCMPYSGERGGNANGIILVGETPVTPDDAKDPGSILKTATLEETYTHMFNELDAALTLWSESGSKSFSASGAAYFPSLCMTYMLQARLYLDQGKNNEAITAADNALTNLTPGARGELVSNGETYYKMYQSVATPTSEDIFTINFTKQDNLSANSINNLFGSYGAAISGTAHKLFTENDIRKILYSSNSDAANRQKIGIYSKCGKYPQEDFVNNVPLMRVPEIYLIKAEAYANLGDETNAANELFNVLSKRDSSVKTVDNLLSIYKTDGKSILDVVLDERRREFVGEGHRWADMRRNQIPLTRNNDGISTGDFKFRITFSGFKIHEFALPIPESETNTGAWKNGRLKQNEAWTGTPGQSYTPVVALPTDKASY